MPLPSLDYYDELYKKRKANKPVATFDPLDAQLRQERDREIREGLFLSASPDTIARVNRVSRVTGEPPVLVEDRVDAYEKSITSDRFMGVVQEHPSIAKWAVNNPRGAAAAVDDSLSLAKFGKAFKDLQDDFLKDDGWLEQAGDFMTRRVRGIQGGFDRFAVATDDFFESLTPEAQKSAMAKGSAPIRREKFKKRAELNEAIQASPIRNEVDWQSVKKNPTVGNIATYIRQQGASSIPDMVLAVASLPVYTAGRSGEIGQERAKNSGRTEATMGDVATASPAALLSGYLDRLGVERLILPGADTVTKRIVKATGIEAGTEFAQEVIEYGGETIGTDVSFNPGEALDRGFAGAVGGAGMAAPIRTGIETPRIIEAVAPVVSKLLQSGNAKKEALFLDNVMKAAEKSKLRERDPDAFKEMLKGMAEENGAANVYVSGEALQEYMQSDSYDPDGPLASWLDQVEEAAATGGDVLMPIEEAAVALQPAWATLKDDVRLSAGGVSRREAQTFDEAMADVMDELEKSMVEQEQATAKKLEPIEKLATSINQKLQNAGFTPSTAKIQADLLVQRYATRAERLGKQLTGNEFDVTVNNVLPEGLAAARNADNLDLVINSYFTMKNPKEQTGKSLIEWISERGGITDDGGDLKSMGLDKWHVGKFKKKALKSSTKGQGNMLGVSDSNYQPDRVLVSAIEAGYFPELDGSTELVDANVLLEAIGEELRGVPRYAQERIVDDVQQLAMQLDEFLGQAGFDTSNMTRDEMRAAIMQAQDAQLGGYTQSTITIDGVERPTQNSNGQPLAQTEEGLRNFWAWFGDSKVVDAEGRPLVVYHGTDKKISKVNLKKGAQGLFWFASDRSQVEGGEVGAARSGVIMELYAKIDEPADWKQYDKLGLYEFKREGLDGAVLKDSDGTFTGFVLNDPTQIKSVNNRGTFDASDPRILFQSGGWLPNSSANQGLAQSLAADAKLLSDVTQSPAFREKGLGGFDAPSRAVVMQRMLAVVDDLQIRDAVISALPVDVVDVLTTRQLAPQVLFDDPSMLSDLLTINSNNSVSLSVEIATQIVSTIASVATESAAKEIGGSAGDGGSAPMAGLGDTGRSHYQVSYNKKTNEATVKRFDPADARILYQPAFHGSPHIFDKFSLDAIGTGEGAQAYGYGLYFAGRREIAEHYRRALSQLPVGSEPKFKGKTIYEWARTANLDNQTQDEKLLFKGLGALRDNRSFTSAILELESDKKNPLNAEAAEWLRENKEELEMPLAGRLYEVDIPEDGEYLLWDAPLSEQPEKVRAALRSLVGGPMFQESMQGFEDTTGSGLHRALKSDMGNTAFLRSLRETKPDVAAIARDDAKVSKLLHDAGVAGIKYLDAGSRGGNAGSYNYVVFDDNAVSIRAYEQSYEDNARGKITFNSGQATIDLFKTRNLSTFLHEVGHLWLEELRFDAELADAPAELKADWETVNKWFASQGYATKDGMIATEAHEMWARGVERYLMEGKSPVPALKRIFETFRVWLTSIYKTVDALKSPITPEIRAVMDRLIATDDQLNDMVERQGIEALFKDAAEAGMTGAEFAAYVDQTQAARNEASGKLLDKTMRSIRAREQKRYKEAEATVRDEISAEVDARPMYKALRLLKTGPMDDAWIRGEFGEDSVRLLPSRVPPVYKAGGIHPDIIAEQSGFDTGKQMVEALMGAELAHRQAKEGGDTRSMRERTISNEVDAVMQARYGDPLNDGSIEREALEAVHNDMQGDVIAAEIRVLARRTGKRPTPYAIAKDWARNKIRAGAVVDEASPSAIQRYARAAAKSATLAQEAMLKQDVDAAFKHKQAQMLNNALVSEAKAALDDVSSAVKRLEKIAKRKTMKSVDQSYLEQAQALLENVDMRRRSQIGLEREGTLAAWAAARTAEGHDIIMSASFEALIGKTNWTKLSVENLLGLDAAIKQIIHLGRNVKSLMDNAQKVDYEEKRQEALNQISKLPPKPPSDLMEPGWKDRFTSGIAHFDAALLKVETVIDWLDGGNLNGVFNRIVFRPIEAAQDRAADMTKEYSGRISDAMDKVKNRSRWRDFITMPELINAKTGRPWKMQRQQLISMALNMGNNGNIQRLVDGYSWDEQAVRNVLNRELSQEDWQFVEDVWTIIDDLWPEIEAMERRLNGVAPEKVEAVPLQTPFGTLRGGYYPAVYDSLKSRDKFEIDNDLFGVNFTRATTRASSTNERVDKVDRPILLQTGVINRHISEVIHDITHREAIMQADKFMSDLKIKAAIDSTLGPAYTDIFRPWLKYIANQWAHERAGNEGAAKWITKAASNATMVGMGFRASTVVLQAAGLTSSIEVVGEKWILHAATVAATRPVETFKFVMERSGEMRTRMDNLDANVRSAVLELENKNGFYANGKKFAFHGIGYADRLVSIPTWLGAYNKAIDAGMSEDDAIYAGNKGVRQSQGSGSPKDLAAVQRVTGSGGVALKLLTMFYSWQSANYQRQRTLGRDVGGAIRDRNLKMTPKLAARGFWLVVMTAALPDLIKAMLPGGDELPEDEEGWAKWLFERILFNALGPMPVVRDVAPISYNAATDEPAFGYRLSPAQGGPEAFVKNARNVGNMVEGEETKRATRDAMDLVGYATGLPIGGQIATATQFIVDVSYDEYDPEGFADWWEGLTKGKLQDDE